jgi:hypothetical protein
MILPGDWGQKPGLEQELNAEEDVKDVPFELKLSVFSWLVLFHPVMLCVLLGTKLSALYFCGRWVLYAAAVVPIWLVVCHVVFANRTVRQGLAPFAYLTMPAVLLFVICEVYVQVLSGQSAVLMSSDCETFQSKAMLERSWWSARDFLMNCADELSQTTGVGINETLSLVHIRECKGYEKAFMQHGVEWTYLEGIEKTYHCGGWCSAQVPIWDLQSQVVDSCSNAVAVIMQSDINILSWQVITYTAVLFVGVSTVLTFSPNWLPSVY